MLRSRTFLAVPPGETIKELLEDRGMKQKELAARMGMSEKHISRLINGEVQLTMDTARRLEMVLGPEAQFWCNLEILYRQEIMKVKEENALCEDLEIMKKIPYGEMAKRGWVEDTSKRTERVMNLRRYFEVAQLAFLQGTLIPGIACRKCYVAEERNYALLAWAQKAKLEARKIRTAPVKLGRLEEQAARMMALDTADRKGFLAELSGRCAECGIALVFLPGLRGMGLEGATFRDGNKIVVGLRERKGIDRRFWFDLYHELAHILCGHIDQPDGTSPEDEAMADRLAEKMMAEADRAAQERNAVG